MIIEIHMLQSFSASNLNRDDLNNPKEVWFGGARRARISSQCIKRTIRTHPIFSQTIRERFSPRTKYLADKLAEVLAGAHSEDEIKLVSQFFAQKLTGGDAAADQTKILLFIGWNEIQMIANSLEPVWGEILAEANAAKSSKAEKKEKEKTKAPAVEKLVKSFFEKIKDSPIAPDIALFGRMLAGKAEFGREGACQVAHAISTHAVKVEMDYYTALDDEKPEDTSGAGMLGYIGYNSACYYRYALLDWHELMQKKNLGGNVALGRLTVEGFLRAMEAATPTGKKHSFDNNSRPAFLLAVVRKENSPGWSLVNAFEKPVQQFNGSGLVTPSLEALNRYWDSLVQVYGDGSVAAVAACIIDPNLSADKLSPGLSGALKSSFNEWVLTVLNALPGE